MSVDRRRPPLLPDGRPPVLPWLSDWAAAVAQVPYKQMSADPTQLANRLLEAHDLLGLGGIACLFDPALLAEAAGAALAWPEDGLAGSGPQGTLLPTVVGHPFDGDPGALVGADPEAWCRAGRLPAVLEATRRLVLTAGRRASVFGVITGPVTLAVQLCGGGFWRLLEGASGDGALEVCGEAAGLLARRYGELGAHGIVVLESLPGFGTGGPAEPIPAYWDLLADFLSTTWNTAEFFGMHSLLVMRGAEGLGALARSRLYSLGADWVDCGQGPPPSPLWTSAGEAAPVRAGGWAVPAATPVALIKSWLHAQQGG